MKTFLLLFMFPFLVHASDFKNESYFNVETEWEDQSGKVVRLKDFQGHPIVLSMVYMTCPFLCPTITSDIKHVEAKLTEKQKQDTRFILISFDPERDTREVRSAFMKKHKLDSGRWILITIKKESKLREMAAVMNFKYQKLEDGEFSHSYVIQAIDRAGVPAARIDGVNKDPKPFAKTLAEL